MFSIFVFVLGLAYSLFSVFVFAKKKKPKEMIPVLFGCAYFLFFVLGHFLLFKPFWSFFSFGNIVLFLLVYFVWLS